MLNANEGITSLHSLPGSSLYWKLILDTFGLDGGIRISPLHCNSAADIDHFLQITMEFSEAASS
jgi:selenocysteine lyase/cysteine desulfurase